MTAKSGLNFDDVLRADASLRRFETICTFLRRIPILGGLAPGATDPDTDLRFLRGPIHSMTPAERRIPWMIDACRCRRISRGCGLSPRVVQRLVDEVVHLEE